MKSWRMTLARFIVVRFGLAKRALSEHARPQRPLGRLAVALLRYVIRSQREHDKQAGAGGEKIGFSGNTTVIREE